MARPHFFGGRDDERSALQKKGLFVIGLDWFAAVVYVPEEFLKGKLIGAVRSALDSRAPSWCCFMA